MGVKACLVMKRFEERLADKRIDSPTCIRQALHLAIVTASIKPYSINISSTFLQRNEIKRTVYVKPPPDLH